MPATVQARGDRRRRPEPRSTAELWGAYRRHLVERAYRSPRTVSSYRQVLYSFWSFIAPVPPERATPKHLHRFLERRPAGPNGRGRALTPATRHNNAAVVTRFYSWAYKTGLLATDRMREVVVPPAALPPPRAIDLGDVDRLLGYAAASDARLHLMVWLAYGSGLRCAEVAALRREDCAVHAERPALHVTGKGRRQRDVPLHPRVAQVVRAALAGGPRTGPLVDNYQAPGEHLKAKYVSALLCAALRALEIPGGAHGLRHSFAVELLAADGGRNLHAVSRLLGHKDVSVTQRYVESYSADAIAAVALLPDPTVRREPREAVS
jgi:integrase/recombinase XerD